LLTGFLAFVLVLIADAFIADLIPLPLDAVTEPLLGAEICRAMPLRPLFPKPGEKPPLGYAFLNSTDGLGPSFTVAGL
jgi:hypothetical protein